jgi:N-acetylglutamate synthase-like GNAT family acetyltransferase
MISAGFFQGIENIDECIKIRKLVFCNELNQSEHTLTDEYDQFAFNVVAYENMESVGTGRLLFKDGRYIIDKICVLKGYRGNNISDLMIRMLVRKAVTIGAEKVYTITYKKCKSIFERAGFEEIIVDDDKLVMVKCGDVGGHCCK